MKKIINRVICSDGLDLLRTLPENVIDLTVTSPPYDTMRSYKGFKFNFEEMSEELYRVTKPGGVVVWIVGDQTIKGDETGTSFKHALGFKDAGFKLFDTMIYLKTPRGAVGSNKTYWQTFEYMFVLSKGTPKTINLLLDRENKDAREGDTSTKRYPDGSLRKLKRSGYLKFGRRTNVWEYLIGKGHSSSDPLAYQHPAIFPEKLAADHIYSWSNPGDLVLDPMCGSGTTLKMAKSLGRNFVGVDISEEYCRLAEARLATLTL
jgi:site-specific DNA-methyltransferase (adenine-specific)